MFVNMFGTVRMTRTTFVFFPSPSEQLEHVWVSRTAHPNASMMLNDRLATFESSAHEVNTLLARFESMARVKGRIAPVLHTRLPMYLGDSEHEWYEGLDPATKKSHPLLRAAFISEYTPKAASRFERETALRSFKQRPDTSVKDFLTKIRHEARVIALPEDKYPPHPWKSWALPWPEGKSLSQLCAARTAISGRD